MCQMVCPETLPDNYWHIPRHSCGTRPDLEKFYVKWQFPGQSWRTNVCTYENCTFKCIYKKRVYTNVIQQCQLKYKQCFIEF